MPSTTLAIDAADLTKRYGSTVTVDGLSLSVPEGTVYGFLGPNGAGKTTTMRMLTGLSEPTSGTASVADAPVTDRDALRGRIGCMPEEPPLYEQATAFEQLEYVGGLRGLSAAAVRDRPSDLFDALGLDAVPSASPALLRSAAALVVVLGGVLAALSGYQLTLDRVRDYGLP
ncbi:ATP-binding cassette domain-containing protein [Halogeometricum limi]|uniref:ABC transporter n=1 Tax=Halogeometricum limi TaxID=555875 RepID=A0A1I6IL40_9EURY|nr:ABC transporter [Halogeometricum limi]